jgi:hypothetical protein
MAEDATSNDGKDRRSKTSFHLLGEVRGVMGDEILVLFLKQANWLRKIDRKFKGERTGLNPRRPESKDG